MQKLGVVLMWIAVIVLLIVAYQVWTWGWAEINLWVVAKLPWMPKVVWRIGPPIVMVVVIPGTILFGIERGINRVITQRR